MSTFKSALITGATGYIGSQLCERLIEDGWKVSAVVRARPDAKKPAWMDQATVTEYDGTTQSVSNSVAAAKPDVVFHLASMFVAEHQPAQIADLVGSNVLFGTQLVDACARQGIKSFINTGTSWQHYRSESYDPVCLYAATKQAFEDVLDFYVDAFGMKAVTLKLFDTYGPGDPRPKLINLLLRTSSSGDSLGMSPGEQRLDLVHITDVVEAFLAAARLMDTTTAAGHERYSVSSGQSVSIQELAELFAEITGVPLRIQWGGRPYRAREVMHPIAAHPSLPNWRPAVPLRLGLAKLVESGTAHSAND